MTRLKRAAQGDDGAALIMALVFLVVVGLFVTVALGKAGSATVGGGALRDRGELQYALDGAIERASDVLRADLAAATDPSLCVEPTGAATDITDHADTGGLQLNGQTVRYKCETLAGRAAKDSDDHSTNYALVITDPAPDALTSQSGVSSDLIVEGSVYLAGRVSNSGLSKPISVTKGDVHQHKDTCDAAQLKAVTSFTVEPKHLKDCIDQSVGDAIPAVDLGTAPSLAGLPTELPLPPAPVILPNGNVQNGPPHNYTCRAFHPGTYLTPPALLTGNGTVNWFPGGVYNFDFVAPLDTWTIPNGARVVVGNGSGGGDAGVPAPTSDCTSSGITGQSGGTFVFGGTSKLAVAGSLAMGTPPASLNSAGPPVNIVALQNSADGFAAWNGGATLLIDNTNATSSVVFNAKIVAREAAVSLYASNPTTAVIRGGAVVKRAHLQASVAAQDIVISAGGSITNPAQTFRTVRLTAVDATGGSTAQNTAVVTISNYGNYAVRALSWRTGGTD